MAEVSRTKWDQWRGLLWPLGATVLSLLVLPVAIEQYPEFFRDNKWILPGSAILVLACWTIPLFVHHRAQKVYSWIVRIRYVGWLLLIVVIVSSVVAMWLVGVRLFRFHRNHLDIAIRERQPNPPQVIPPPPHPQPPPQSDLPKSFVLLSPIFPVMPVDHETILILQKGPDSIYNIDMMFWDRPKIHAAHSFAKKALGMFKIHIPELDPSSGGVLPQIFDWQTVSGPARQFEAITTAKGLSIWQTTMIQKIAGQWQYMTRITQYGGKDGGKVIFECKTPSYPTADEHIKTMQSCI